MRQQSDSQKWWVLCSFAYLRWRRRDVCNFHMIYIDDIIHNCMCVIFWTWKWYNESQYLDVLSGEIEKNLYIYIIYRFYTDFSLFRQIKRQDTVIESSWIKWNKNWWKQLNIRGSWTKWKSEATNPFLALRVYVKMSEIHKTGGVWHKI